MQLYARDIIDVGTIISEESTELFLRSCYFGEDSEDSVAMSLTEAGKTRWFLNGEKLVQGILNKKRTKKKIETVGGGDAAVTLAVEREKNTSAAV
jgi:membrane carboxypeptidase/penicillin-binding protein PbpC